MTTSSDSNLELEALERSRRRMLMAVVATSSVWIVSAILQSLLTEGLPHVLRVALVLAGVVGALVFVVFMLRFHRFQARLHDHPDLSRRLDDERVIALRKEAIYRGWVVLVLALGVGVAIAPFVELPGQAVLLTLMLLAVNAPIVFFLGLDRG